MTEEFISKSDVIKIIKSVLSPASSLTNVPRARGQMLVEINELESQPEPHWIPVTKNCDCDLMDNEEVLVFQKDGTINGQIRHALFYDFNGKKKFVTWEEGITIYNVLAYMPLPEPYKGVTE